MSRSVRSGILLGCGAILLWSTSSAGTVWAASMVGPWQFLAVACAISTVTQAAALRALGMPLRRMFAPAPRLWSIILGCFVPYMIVYTLALVLAQSKAQQVGVSLANYLWPTLTVAFAVVLVPSVRMSGRLAMGSILALAGLGLAFWPKLEELFLRESSLPILPYVLGVAAAIAWGLFSATLARWRSWANQYSAAPLGFLLTAIIAAAACTIEGWRPMSWQAMAGVAFVGLLPEGIGYLLWELALHRAPASTLGLLGSATPVLSTFWMLALYTVTGDGQPPQNVGLLMAAACIIGGAVLIGALPRKRLEVRGE